MDYAEWNNLNEERFDALLTDSLPELPPDAVAEEVTPWKRSVNRILAGLALTSITLNFWCLNYILPAIGTLLLLLGFRSLRGENGWLRCCYGATALRTPCLLTVLILQTTIFPSLDSFAPLSRILDIIFLVLLVGTCFCLWRGLLAVQRRAGLPLRAPGAAWTMVWYCLVCLLALLQYQGLFFGFAMLAGFVCILCSLRQLARDLEQAGYAIRTAPIRVTDLRLTLSLSVLLLAGMVCGYAFGGTYPMEWTPAEIRSGAEVQEIRAQLLELGFPEEVLADLTDEDIAACAGASQVVVDVTEEPVNDGRGVTTHVKTEQGTHISQNTVYDQRELRITGVAVRIPGEREQWRIFHHFLWTLDTGFWGTESIQVWPAWQNLSEGWSPDGSISGRVLCDRSGQTFSAPFYSLDTRRFAQTSFLSGTETRTDPFACFSFPRDAENRRCYVAYGVLQNQKGWLFNSWVNYTHQRTWLQYPVRTAMEHRMTNPLERKGAFRTVQDALQFYPDGEEIHAIG